MLVGHAERAASARRLDDLFTGIAAGRFPPADGGVEVLPQPPGRVAGVLAFNAHHVVVADVEPSWVHSRLPAGHLAAPMAPAFLDALGRRLGRHGDSLDLVLWAPGGRGETAVALDEVVPDGHHPRVARALRYRTDVRVLQADGGAGLLILGRGLGGRWEAAFEVDEAVGGRGLGRALAASAPRLVPDGDPVFVQIAPGNASSLRAVLATGAYTVVGGELLLPEP